jgi:DNA-binding MarR family transcriptional regulator
MGPAPGSLTGSGHGCIYNSMDSPDDLQAIARSMRSECLAMRVRQLNRRVTRLYDAALRPHGVSTAQLNVLAALALLGETRATDVAAALALEKSTLSRNLDRMVARGWVEVAAGQRGVGQQLRLLPAGRRVVEDALPAWRAAQRQAAAEFPAELVEALRRGEGRGKTRK